jgi:3-methyladenine DNA glycosylase AlkD
MTKYNDIIKQLETLSNQDSIKGMARFGITPEHTFGVSIPNLRKIAREIKTDHELALKLWSSDIRETRILASMIADPQKVIGPLIDNWVIEFDYWEICDQCCMNLFEKTKFAYQKAVEYSAREEEFVKRTGFVLMARLAVSDKKAEDSKFEIFFPFIKKESIDERNFVKKAINWALRQIGKRNLNLNKKAIELAKEIQKIDSKSAKWITSDAIRELTSDDVQRRLKKKI